MISVFLSIPFILFSQGTAGSAPASDAAPNKNAPKVAAPIIKKVIFNPGKRNPFLSQEEVIAIEQKRKAELRRQEEEKANQLRLAQKAREEMIRKQIEEEENRRYPARKIMNKINVEGILGKEAIINGEIVGIGSKVFGAKVVAITDDSVWFLFEGQRFQRKLPLL